jgi:hypothetical protein
MDKIGVSNPGSITECFSDMKDLDATGFCEDKTRFANSGQAAERTGPKYESRP